jgi:hypothetical protein
MNREQLILCFVLLVIVSLSGCGINDQSQGNFTPEYKDEALKMETEITGQVLPSQVINMKVRLTNQVRNDIDTIELRITDFYGLKLISEICGDDPTNKLSGSTTCGISAAPDYLCGCNFTNIQSLDQEDLTFVFRIPDQNRIAMIGRELKPEFTLSYHYYGESKYLIPILKPYEKSTTTKIESVQTEGPIHVDIERGFTSSSNDWEIHGSQFSVILRVKDVISSRNDVVIDKNRFHINLNNLVNRGETDSNALCDFRNKAGGSYYIPDQNITLPMVVPLVCVLEANNNLVPWVYGEIRVEYDYNYRTVKTEIIDVETIIA